MIGGEVWRASPEEQEELEAFLKSKILARAPSVLRIAEYIAARYLEGQGSGLKEYNIAVEALGKPVDFDPKRDSIVRVETYRLRKKLAEFYKTEGSGHKLRLVLDPGQYVPRFVPNGFAIPDEAYIPEPSFEELTPTPVTAQPEAIPEFRDAPPTPGTAPRRSQALRAVLLTAVLALALGAPLWLGRKHFPAPKPDTIRIVSGASSEIVLVSPAGPLWRGDRWVEGGRAFENRQATPTEGDLPLQFHREGDFTYAIPLAATPWELRLYFAGSSPRGFDVLANQTKLLDSSDPVVGEDTFGPLTIRVFRDIRPAQDGKLHLAFRSGSKAAFVNLIELTPGEPGKLLPIRMIAKTAPYTDSAGRQWEADHYVEGGTLTIRTEPIPGRIDQNIVSGERYGTFTYRIPVAAGRYRLTLYLAETWFGPTGAGKAGGVGSRRFDVYANRGPLLQNFDIFVAAGQSNRAITKIFHDLTPDARGYINLSFLPRVNNACVNALELVDEGRS